jgi:hypothetical protein
METTSASCELRHPIIEESGFARFSGIYSWPMIFFISYTMESQRDALMGQEVIFLSLALSDASVLL